MTKYVILAHEFGYDNFYLTEDIEDTSIFAEFDDQETAQAKLKSLVADELRSNGLDVYDFAHGYGSYDEVEDEVEKFCQTKSKDFPTGMNAHEFFDGMSDDDIFEFAQIANIMPYELKEQNEEDKNDYYVIWLNKEQTYLKDSDSEIVYGTKYNFTEGNYDLFMHFEGYILKGTVEDISKYPMSFNSLMNDKYLISQESENEFRILMCQYDDVLDELNSVLREPLYKVEAISYKKLQNLMK